MSDDEAEQQKLLLPNVAQQPVTLMSSKDRSNSVQGTNSAQTTSATMPPLSKQSVESGSAT